MEHVQKTVGICKPTEHNGATYATRVSSNWAKFFEFLGYSFKYNSEYDAFLIDGISGTQFYVTRQKQKAMDSCLLRRNADYQTQICGSPWEAIPRENLCPRCGLIGADTEKLLDGEFNCPLCFNDEDSSRQWLIADSFALIQYVYCAIENYDTEVSSSTKINRFKLFELKATEISDERKYQNWTLNVPALDLDMMTKMQSGIIDNLWNYDPDAGWADYGDSDFIGMEDIEIEEIGVSQYRKPLVIE